MTESPSASDRAPGVTGVLCHVKDNFWKMKEKNLYFFDVLRVLNVEAG